MPPKINSTPDPNLVRLRPSDPAPAPSVNVASNALIYDLGGADNMFRGHLSVEAELLAALSLQTTSAEADLYEIIGDMRSNNAKKEQIRKLQSALRSIESAMGNKDKKPSDADKATLAAAEANFRAILEQNGWADSPLAKVLGRRPDGENASKEDVTKWSGELKDELDAYAQSFSDMGEENNIKLQLALSKKSQFEQAQSQSMKSIDESAKAIVRNIG